MNTNIPDNNVVVDNNNVKFDIEKYRVYGAKELYTFQCIEGGKYFINDSNLVNFFRYIINKKNICICQSLPKKNQFKLYLDIDNFDNKVYTIITILTKTNDYLKTAYGLNDLDYTVCKNNGAEKYHVYYNDIITNRENCIYICKTINKDVFNDEKILDFQTYSSCFRLPFVLKYDNRKNDYMKDTDYNLVDENYEKIELTIDDKIDYLLSVNLSTDRPLSKNFIVKKTAVTVSNNIFIKNKTDNMLKIFKLLGEISKDYYFKPYEERLKVVTILAHYYKERNYSLDEIKSEIKNCFECIFTEQNIKENDTMIEKCFNNDDNEEKLTIGTMIYFLKNYKEIDIKDIINILNVESEYGYINRNVIEGCDASFVDLFTKFYENFIYQNGYVYYYNEMLWIKDKDDMNITNYLMYDLFNKCNRAFEKNKKDFYKKNKSTIETVDYENALKNKLKTMKMKLRNDGPVKSIINLLKKKLYKKVKFDTNNYYFVFDNGIYDLKKFVFKVKTEREEYISNTMSCNYNYEEVPSDIIADFERDYLNKILSNPREDKMIYLSLLASCLTGILVKKFVINNGNGNNGKSNLSDLLMECLGDYGFILDIKQFCVGNKKDSAMLFNINNKRLVIMEEPEKNSVLDAAEIKKLTGNSTYSCRKIYSDTSIINMKALFMVNCNSKPSMSVIDNAITDRLIDFEYKSKFVKETDEDYICDDKEIFLANTYYKTEEFINKSRIVLFHCLLKYLPMFYKNGEDVVLNKSLKERVHNYITDTDIFFEWIEDQYEITGNKDDYVSIADMYSNFKYSDLKKSMNLTSVKKFIIELKTRKVLNKMFVEERTIVINGESIKLKKGIMNGLKIRD